MTTSKEIRVDLDRLTARRVDLQAETDEAKKALTSAQDGLVSGSATVAQVTTAQATHDALHGAVVALDARIQDAEAALQAAQAKEAEQQRSQRLVEIESEKKAAATAYAEAAGRANEALLAIVPEMLQQTRRWGELITEQTRLRQQANGANTVLSADAFPFPAIEPFGPNLYEALERFAAKQDRTTRKAG